MKLHIAIGQPRQNYEGQYGLDTIMSATEYMLTDDPEIIQKAISDATRSGNYEALSEIVVEVDEEEIRRILYKNNNPIKGKIVEEL